MEDWKKDRLSAEIRESEKKIMAEAAARSKAEEAAKPKEYKTVEEIADKIRRWELDEGESFTDYFSHDNIANQSWAFWLLGKGYTDHANKLIDKMTEEGASCYIDQDELYEIHDVNPDGEWSEEPHEKNIAIMAEFLNDSTLYSERVNKFFNDKQFQQDD